MHTSCMHTSTREKSPVIPSLSRNDYIRGTFQVERLGDKVGVLISVKTGSHMQDEIKGFQYNTKMMVSSDVCVLCFREKYINIDIITT